MNKQQIEKLLKQNAEFTSGVSILINELRQERKDKKESSETTEAKQEDKKKKQQEISKQVRNGHFAKCIFGGDEEISSEESENK